MCFENSVIIFHIFIQISLHKHTDINPSFIVPMMMMMMMQRRRR